MRKILCFIILIVLGNGFRAQNLNHAQHYHSDYTKNIVSINSKSFYLENTNSKSADSCNVVGVNETGQIIFKKKNYFGDANPPIKLIVTLDKKLVLAGTSHCCDCGSPNDKNYLIKLDTNGNVIFQTFIQFFYGGALNRLRDFTQHSDSSFYLVSDSLLYHYSKSGAFVSKKNTGMTSIKSISLLNNGNLLFNGDSVNVNMNVEMTTTLSIVNQQTSIYTTKKFVHAPNGVLFGLTTLGNLVSYSLNLSPINNSTATLNSNLSFGDFIIRNDSIFVVGISSPLNKAFFGILDQNFNLIFQSQSNYKNVYPSGITLDNRNNIRVITKGTSQSSPSISFRGFYQFRINGGFVSQSDIGVIAISAGASTVIPAGFGGVYYSTVSDMSVTVKNHGTDTVKSFYLNKYGGYTICGFTIFHRVYYDQILPNGTVTVQTGSMYFDNITGPFQSNTISKRLICLFTTVPNSTNDIEILNDEGCDSIPFIRPVGIEENYLNESNVKLYPSPFQNYLKLECDYQIHRVKIFNALGQTIKDQILNEKQFVFETSDLQSGIYFIKIETERGTLVKKVIKE